MNVTLYLFEPQVDLRNRVGNVVSPLDKNACCHIDVKKNCNN
jgi:hypothetical protein